MIGTSFILSRLLFILYIPSNEIHRNAGNMLKMLCRFRGKKKRFVIPVLPTTKIKLKSAVIGMMMVVIDWSLIHRKIRIIIVPLVQRLNEPKKNYV